MVHEPMEVGTAAVPPKVEKEALPRIELWVESAAMRLFNPEADRSIMSRPGVEPTRSKTSSPRRVPVLKSSTHLARCGSMWQASRSKLYLSFVNRMICPLPTLAAAALGLAKLIWRDWTYRSLS